MKRRRFLRRFFRWSLQSAVTQTRSLSCGFMPGSVAALCGGVRAALYCRKHVGAPLERPRYAQPLQRRARLSRPFIVGCVDIVLRSEDVDPTSHALGKVGLLPRLLSSIFLVLFSLAGLVGWVASGVIAAFITSFALGVVLVGFSFRPKIWTDDEAVFVRSYFGTRRFAFIDVLTFHDVPYSGLWNRGAGTESWLNFGMRMIIVIRLRGSTIPFPATLSSRRTCTALVAALNARLPNEGGADRTHE